MPKSVKIFISSTFRDMNAERDVLIKRVFPLLREKAETELGVQVREIDLRWGVTEEQAKRGEVEGLCIDGIEACKPYFLSMIGARYGWIPAPAWVRKAELDAILNGNALNQEEKDFLRRVYNLADVDARVYTLDVGIANEEKDRAQQLLAKGGLTEAGISITEKEIRHALDNTELPRFIPELERRINEHAGMPDDQKSVLRTSYVRSGGEPVWHLQPGATDSEIAALRKALDSIEYSRDYHRFFFMRDDSTQGFYRKHDKGDIDTTYVDTEPSQQQKLRALKQRIRDSKASETCDEYPCTWNAENIGKEESSEYPVTGLDAFEQKVFNALWSHMQQNPELKAEQEPYKTANWDSLEQHEQARIRELYYEHQQQLKFIDSRTYNFRGREKLLDTIEQSVAQAIQTKDSGYVMVVGEPGSGKSALLATVYNRLIQSTSSNQPSMVIIPRFIGASSRSTNPLYLIRDCCFILKDAFGLDDEVPDDPNKLKTAFTDILGKTDRPVVIILDAINQLQKGENARRMRWLPDRLPENVCVLTSVVEDTRSKETAYDIEQDTTALQSMRNRRPAPAEIPVGKLTEDEKRDIIASYLRQYNKRLSGQQLKTIAAKRESYNPLYVQCALEELRIVSRHEELDTFINELPPTTVKVFRSILDRVEHDLARRFSTAESDFFRKFMVYMATGRNGMTEQDLRLLLGDWRNVKEQGEEQTRISEFHWGELRRCLRPYLFQRGEQWDFFHQQLKQAVGEKYLEKEQSRREAHKSIADYLEVMGYEHVSTARDLPHHRVKSGEWQEAAKVMTDFGYHYSRLGVLGTSDVTEVMHDFQMVQAAPEPGGEFNETLDIWSRFYRENAHHLRREGEGWQPQSTLLQRADFHADSSPVTRGAQRWLADKGSALPWTRILGRPKQLMRSACLQTLEGHDGAVFDVALQPDRRRAVSASDDNTLKLWDLETGACMRTLEGHNSTVKAVSIHPDGQRAVSASGNGTLKLWDLETGAHLRKLEAHNGGVNSVAFHPDGRRAVSASGDETLNDKTLKVWDLESGKCLETLKGHKLWVEAIAIHHDGWRAVSASTDGTVKVWNLETGECLHTLEGHKAGVTAVALHNDGRRAVSASLDKTLKVWDLESGECLQTLEGHSLHVNAVALHSDGRRAVSASHDNTLKVWDLESGKCLRTLEGHTRGVIAVALQRDGPRAVSASTDKTLKVWNLESKETMQMLEGHSDSVHSVALHSDGRRAVSASHDKTLKVWDLESGECLHTLEGHTGPVNSVALHNDGRRAVTASSGGTLKVWDLEDCKCLRTIKVHKSLLVYFVLDVALHNDGRRAVSRSLDKTLKVWDLNNGKCLRTLEGHTSDVSGVALHRDDRRAVSFASRERTLKVWELESGECLRTVKGHMLPVNAVALHPDGQRVVSASEDKTLKVWDLNNGKCLRTMKGHKKSVRAVALHRDGRRAVSAGNDTALKVWDLETGECLRTLEGHTSDVSAVALNGDGWRAVSRSHEALKVWDLESGQCIATYSFDSGIGCCAWHDDQVLAGAGNGSVLLTMFPGKVVAALPGRERGCVEKQGQPHTKPEESTDNTNTCPYCGGPVVLQEWMKGKEIDCPHCGRKIKISQFVVGGSDNSECDEHTRSGDNVSDSLVTREQETDNNADNSPRRTPWWEFWKK